MAFNLVNHFRKYQKMWMASVLLLSMVTFVLCTGVGGDFSDTLLRWVATPRGELLASFGHSGLLWSSSTDYYYRDLDELRKQRNLVNEFMFQAVTVCRSNLQEQQKDAEKALKDPKASENARLEARRNLGLLSFVNDQLLYRTEKKQHYFGTGVKLDELVDFLLWRNEADRLGISLTDDKVLEMLSKDLFVPQTRFDLGQMQAILNQVGRNIQVRTSRAFLFEALRQEYRVQMAQLSLATSQPLAYLTKERELGKWNLPLETRMPLSPAQLWDLFQQKRTEFDVALVPVHVSDFLKQVATPSPQELTSLFEQYKKELYDPASATPGFKIPHRIKAEWIGGDPESPYYQKVAQALNQLQRWPLLTRNPLAAGLAGVAVLSTPPLAWEGYLDRIYHDVRSRARSLGDPETVIRQACLSVPLTEADVLPALVARLTDRPTPAMVAALVSGLARPDGLVAGPEAFRALAYQQHRPLLDSLVKAEVKARVPLYAGLVAAGAGPRLAQASYIRTLWSAPTLQHPILPLVIVAPELEKIAHNNQAQTWVNANMSLVWRELNDRDVRGKPTSMSRRVKELVEQFGLQHGTLTEFHDRYAIAQAPALATLKKSFDMYFDQINQIEGRVSPERRLLADDFYKLFFGGESFSASGGNYQVRLWPPEVTPPLNPLQPEQERQTTSALWDTAEKPFLFWKTKDEEARVPDSLDQVKDHVEQAWKKLKARDKAALAEVKTVAVALEKKSGADYGPVLQELEKKLGREAIYLKKIAPWSPFLSGQRKLFYGEYALPKGLIDYPPEDLVKQLLTLPDLSKPFQTGNKEIDALNLQLFEDGKKLPTVEGVGKYVQVVANKPRTVFYVACVVRQGTPDFRYFADECFRKAASPNLDAYDPFLDRCQNEAAKQFREAFLQQLRSEQKVKVTDDKKVRDSFDSATSS